MPERSFGPIKDHATPIQWLRKGCEDKGAKRYQNKTDKHRFALN